MVVIRQKLQRLIVKKSFKNFLMLVTGTALAQIINLLAYPLITRLYEPESFGALGYYTSTLSLLVPLSNLCYPLAIILPRTKDDANKLLALSVSLTLLSTLICTLLLPIIHLYINIPFDYAYIFIPSGILFSSLVLIFTQTAIRQLKYKAISIISIILAILGGVLKVIGGYILPTEMTLIAISLLTLVIQVLILFNLLNLKVKDILGTRIGSIKNIACEYIRFPLYRTPHSLLALVSQLAPVFLLTQYFGAKQAGYFVLTRSILIAPISLLGKSIYDVCYPIINENYHNNVNNFNIVFKLTLILILCSLVPLIVLFFYGQPLFKFIFGDEWGTSGIYASWMAFWFAFNLFNRPAAAAISVYSMDKFLFRNGIVNNIISLSGFFLGAIYFKSDIVAVALFSLFGIFSQLNLILYTLKVIKS